MEDDELEVLAYYFFKDMSRIEFPDGTVATIDLNKAGRILEQAGVVGLDYNNDRMLRKMHA